MNTICIDCRYVGRRPSGIGEVVQQLARFAPAIAPDLQFLLLRNPARISPLCDLPNVREIDIASPANGPGTMWWLHKLVDLSGVDLFHAPANILPGKLTMPTMVTIHDIMWLTQPYWCNPRAWGLVERRFYRLGIERALDRATHIATVSAATRDAILELRPDLAGRIGVTRSGVSKRFAPQIVDPAVLRRLGLDPARRFVLTIGQNAPYKNHEGALRGFAAAFANQTDIDLVFVHRRDTGSNALLQLAEDLGLSSRVYLLATLAEDELVQLYCSALALLHPSLCEGFGNPVAEAMACGCPVVTSNKSAMAEVAGNAGLLVDPYDTATIGHALSRIAREVGLAERLGRAGIARAAELDWREFAAANVALYRKCLGSG